MLRSVMVENQTFSKLQYGSGEDTSVLVSVLTSYLFIIDLILPSVVPVEEGGYSLRNFNKGDYCSVRVKGQE